MTKIESLIAEARACSLCEKLLPSGVRPVFQLHPDARILIAGQAPGRKVHESGIPFSDASGDRLREWLGVPSEIFYDCNKIAILPMGFCYPGTGKSGDLPPRPECEPAWRKKLLSQFPNLEITLVLGKYAQAYHFDVGRMSLTTLVQSWRSHWPAKVPLPHPSPRNNIWLSKNSWFEEELLPELRKKISKILNY